MSLQNLCGRRRVLLGNLNDSWVLQQKRRSHVVVAEGLSNTARSVKNEDVQDSSNQVTYRIGRDVDILLFGVLDQGIELRKKRMALDLVDDWGDARRPDQGFDVLRSVV